MCNGQVRRVNRLSELWVHLLLTDGLDPSRP